MTLLTNLLLTFSCGLMDRFRGTGSVDVFYSKSIESYIYGLFVGAIFLSSWWHVLIFAALWGVGASFGWGTPLGSLMRDTEMDQSKLEWWQFGPFKTNVVFACVLRGVLWGACVLPVAYLDPKAGVFFITMGAIFPTAMVLAKKFSKVSLGSMWETQEFYRGWLVGSLALLLSLV